jgi:AcrR family transcriptional regulator
MKKTRPNPPEDPANTAKKMRAKPSEKKSPPDRPAASAVRARGARRKLQTRERLLDAALTLMSNKGMEGVAINEITDKADVGFGSFYNHFASKEAIYLALIDKFFEEFADALEISTASLEDPAEVIAASIQHTIRRSLVDPVWGRFLIREGLSAQALSRGLGRRLMRDIRKGVAASRFVITDPGICFLAVGGTVLAAVTTQLAVLDNSDASILALFGADDELGPFGQRISAICLQILGLKASHAHAISVTVMEALELSGAASASDQDSPGNVKI